MWKFLKMRENLWLESLRHGNIIRALHRTWSNEKLRGKCAPTITISSKYFFCLFFFLFFPGRKFNSGKLKISPFRETETTITIIFNRSIRSWCFKFAGEEGGSSFSISGDEICYYMLSRRMIFWRIFEDETWVDSLFGDFCPPLSGDARP